MITLKTLQKWFSLGLATVAALVLCGGVSAASALNSASRPAGHKPIVKLRHGTSSNWSGYAAYGSSGSFSNVSASWQQPAVSCNSQNTYSSYWVGLDGYNTSTVEQLGTEADCSSGSASYYAWFEMYPRWGYYINMSVHPGDNLSASVTYSGAGRYTLKLADTTTGQSFKTVQKLASARRASAEAIVEAPWNSGTLPLANFGTANFSNALANNAPLGGFSNLDPITMLNPYGSKATPSAFDSTKKNFSVAWSTQ